MSLQRCSDKKYQRKKDGRHVSVIEWEWLTLMIQIFERIWDIVFIYVK